MSTPTTPLPIDLSRTQRNLDVETLIQHCLERDGCELTASGAVVAYSGKYTGRTPKDKHTVRDSSCESRIWWDNNRPLEPEAYALVRETITGYLSDKPLYVVDTFAGADPDYRIAVRFIVERPYHALFIKQLLIRPTAEELATFTPDWTVIDAGKLSMRPGVDPVPGDAIIALNLAEREVLIAGTEYAGEMKK
jgi:phosphoenolpyruvate carboxykinase (ATP)